MSNEDRVALGHVIAVSGSQATAQFSAASLASGGEFGFSVGSLIGIENGASLAIGALCDITLQAAANADAVACAVGRIDLLGEISAERRFQSGVAVYPRIGSAVVDVGADDLKTIFDLASPRTVELGHLQQDASITATVNVDEMVRKHFAIFGSTGSGKSSALALILRKIMQARSDLRILLIDAHNEYAECFDGRAHVFGPENLNLPFWLFNFEELVEVIFGSRGGAEREVSLLADLIPLAKTDFARTTGALRSNYRAPQTDGASRFTADTPAPYRLEDVIAMAESRMGKLENRDLAVTYQRLARAERGQEGQQPARRIRHRGADNFLVFFMTEPHREHSRALRDQGRIELMRPLRDQPQKNAVLAALDGNARQALAGDAETQVTVGIGVALRFFANDEQRAQAIAPDAEFKSQPEQHRDNDFRRLGRKTGELNDSHRLLVVLQAQ